MSNENVYLPGKIRDRIQDLMKANKVTQAELAARIGCSESMVIFLRSWRKHPFIMQLMCSTSRKLPVGTISSRMPVPMILPLSSTRLWPISKKAIPL